MTPNKLAVYFVADMVLADMVVADMVCGRYGRTPATVISCTVFDLDIVFSAITTTDLTVVDQSNTCTQIARPV